jgi:hypothetical protein
VWSLGRQCRPFEHDLDEPRGFNWQVASLIAGGGGFVPIEKELGGPVDVEEAMVEVTVVMVEELLKIGYLRFALGAGVMLRPQGAEALTPSSFLCPTEQDQGVFLEDEVMLGAAVLVGLEGVRMTNGSEG